MKRKVEREKDKEWLIYRKRERSRERDRYIDR
jgi:hypothetical protein